MNHYITGATIKRLRENNKMTQAELAKILGVSHKTISKWETAKGLPDITLIEPLAKALKISVMELLSGEDIINQNKSANMLRSRFYVCPVCGNVIHTTGEAAISCCGITLPVLEAEETEESHFIHVERVEDEYFVTVNHEMTKEHYISFIAYVTSSKLELIKLYPEGNAEGRFLIRGHGMLYCYCNKHGQTLDWPLGCWLILLPRCDGFGMKACGTFCFRPAFVPEQPFYSGTTLSILEKRK